MNIAFFTEMSFTGKITRTHENMRTEFAWMCALNADHYHISLDPTPIKDYDLGIIIIPKKNPGFKKFGTPNNKRSSRIFLCDNKHMGK